LCCLFAVLVLLAVPAGAGAEGWTAPAARVLPGSDVRTDAAVGRDGTVAISVGGSRSVLVRPPAGEIGPPHSFAPADSAVSVAVGPGGEVLAGYVAGGELQLAARPAGGAFGPLRSLGPSSNEPPEMAFLADGSAVIAWQRPGGGKEPQVVPRAANGELGPVQTFALPTENPPSLTVGPGGQVLLAYRVIDAGTSIVSALRPAGEATFRDTQLVSGDSTASTFGGSPVGAFRPDGSAELLWVTNESTPPAPPFFTPGVASVLRWNSRGAAPSAPWGTAQVLEAGSSTTSPVPFTPISDPDLAVDAAGASMATWTYTTGPASPTTRTSRRAAGAPAMSAPTQYGTGGWFAQLEPLAPGIVSTVLEFAGDLRGGFVGGAGEAPTHLLQDGEPSSPPQATLASQPEVVAAAWTVTPPSEDTTLRTTYYDNVPPVIGAQLPRAEVGEPVTLDAAASDRLAPPVAVRWDLGGGLTAEGQKASAAFGRPGSFPISITATDAVGNTVTEQRTLTVADTRKPVLSKVRLSRKRFRVGPKRTALTAAKRGTRLSFTSSEAGRAAIAAQQARKGWRKGKRCVARRPRTKPGAKRPKVCTRWVARGTLRRGVAAGANRVAFSGKLGRKALRRGRYRFSMRVTDGAGNRSARKRIGFRIVRR
jgi:hypothetical protein